MKGKKSAVQTISVGVLVFGLEALAQQQYSTFGATVFIAFALEFGYEMMEESQHKTMYTDLIEEVGVTGFTKAAQRTGDEIDEAVDDLERGEQG